jgi:hypothetical protein
VLLLLLLLLFFGSVCCFCSRSTGANLPLLCFVCRVVVAGAIEGKFIQFFR